VWLPIPNIARPSRRYADLDIVAKTGHMLPMKPEIRYVEEVWP
jgi:hypothetical protein